MIRDTQTLVHNITGQTIYFDVPSGRASSITSVSVYRADATDDGTAESATTGSSSNDTCNTTCDAASGAGQANAKTLNVTATTGFVVGRQFLATTSAGTKEWFEVTAIDSGNSVTTRTPLANAFVSTNTVQGTRLSISVADTWIQDKGKITDGNTTHPGYRVRWVYVIGGATETRYTYLRVVRAKGVHNVRLQDLELLVPGISEVLATDHRIDGAQGLIDEAHKQVALDLRAAGIPDSQARDQDLIDELTKQKAVYLWARAKSYATNDYALLDSAKADYRDLLDSLVRGPSRSLLAVDLGESGVASTMRAVGVTRR